MSKLSKFVVFILILASVASACLGLWIQQKRQVDQRQLAAIEESVKKAPPPITYTGDIRKDASQLSPAVANLVTELSQAQAHSEEAKTRITELENELQAAKANAERLVIENTEASKQVKAINDQLIEARAELVPLRAKAKETEDLLAGRSIQSLLDEITRLQGLLTLAAQASPPTGAPQAGTAAAASSQATSPSPALPPGAKAKVLAVNKVWNFVVLNMGREAGLPANAELPVYRGNQMIGKVRTVSVEAKTAVADILPEYKGAGITVGDIILFKP